jgi:hypothetical protein
MKSYVEINVKSGMPLVHEAMDYLERKLSDLRREKCKCVVVIHGYGSTGKGGAIGKAVRRYLMEEKAKGRVKAVVFGENLTIFNFEALAMKSRYPELAPYFSVCNEGITAVEL